MNQVTLKQLIGHGQFFSQTLLNAEAFVRYCEAREIKVSLKQLERYEELGIFLPLVRLRHPKIKVKIELREDGNRYGLGSASSIGGAGAESRRPLRLRGGGELLP